MVELGQFALLLSLFLSSYAIVVDILGSWRRDAGLIKSGRNATISCLACLTVAMAVLWVLLIRSDFSVIYVAENTARLLPIQYKISALWAGSAGSLLLWLWMQVGFVVFVYCMGRSGRSRFSSHARTIANLVSVFFLIVMIYDTNPFATLPKTPADGMGLNPLLQHPAMVLHPPILFVGYAAFMIPFVWAFGWLKHREQVATPLLRRARNWALTAWLFLTAGIVLGAWWAYEELGWGGYWAWDPVENSSLMPWITGTALLHCFRTYKERSGISVWAMFLCLLTFSLCVFGRFLTKSGFVTSVHAFPDPGMSRFYIYLLAHVWVIAGVLLIRKFVGIGRTRIEPALKGHRFIVWGNWLFLLLTLVILVGTLFPRLCQALRWFLSLLMSNPPEIASIELEPSFFTKITSPAGIVMLLLIGLCPHLIRYGIDKGRRVVLGIVSAVAACVMWFVGCFEAGAAARESGAELSAGQWLLSGSPAIPVFILSGFMLVNLVADVIGYEVNLFRRRKAGTGGKHSLRWYGARIVHIGVAIMFIGIAGSGGYGKELEIAMRPGEKVDFEGYELTYDDMSADHGPNFTAVIAAVSVRVDGELITQLKPSQAVYTASGKRVPEIDVRRTLAGDLYMALTGMDVGSGLVNLKIMSKPLINWVWIGSMVMCVGAMMVILALCLPKGAVVANVGKDEE